MLTNAVILAALSASGLVVIWKRLPNGMRQYIIRHPIQGEIAVFVITFGTLGGSLTALFAGSIVSAITSVLLHIAEHPEQYTEIIMLKDFVAQKTNSIWGKAKSLIREHIGTQPKVLEVAA